MLLGSPDENGNSSNSRRRQKHAERQKKKRAKKLKNRLNRTEGFAKASAESAKAAAKEFEKGQEVARQSFQAASKERVTIAREHAEDRAEISTKMMQAIVKNSNPGMRRQINKLEEDQKKQQNTIKKLKREKDAGRMKLESTTKELKEKKIEAKSLEKAFAEVQVNKKQAGTSRVKRGKPTPQSTRAQKAESAHQLKIQDTRQKKEISEKANDARKEVRKPTLRGGPVTRSRHSYKK